MKKYDPYMHTTEHILNQTMIRMFGCDRSYSMHLEKKKSKCDFKFDRPLTKEEEKTIEERVNKIISLSAIVMEGKLQYCMLMILSRYTIFGKEEHSSFTKRTKYLHLIPL